MEDSIAKTVKNTQKILNKLISEERIAVDFYLGAISNVNPTQRCIIEEKFTEIGIDEKNDHLKKLVRFANTFGYDVPFKYKDFEKYASKKMVSKFNGLKNGKDALYYIENAIESEKDAIQSYEEALAEECVFDFQPVLLNAYYDEIQHLEDLELLCNCVKLGVVLK